MADSFLAIDGVEFGLLASCKKCRIRQTFGVQGAGTARPKDRYHTLNREGLPGLFVRKGIRNDFAKRIDAATLLVLEGLQAEPSVTYRKLTVVLQQAGECRDILLRTPESVKRKHFRLLGKARDKALRSCVCGALQIRISPLVIAGENSVPPRSRDSP